MRAWRPHLSATLGVIGATLLVSACGTTLPPQAAGDVSGAVDARGTVNSGAGQTSTSLAGPSPSSSSAGAPAQSVGTAGGPSANSVGELPGASSGEAIRIGIETVEDSDSVGSTFGVGSGQVGSWTQQYQAVVDDINEHGGVNGRRLEPVYYGYRFDGGSWVAQEQAACTHLTEDNTVVAVLALEHSETGLGCYEAAGVPQVVGTGFSTLDEADYARYAHVTGSGGFVWDRTVRVLSDALASEGYFDRNPTIGVVSHDGPRWDRVVARFADELERRGLHIAVDARLPEFHVAGEGGSFAAAVQNAVLKMSVQGVTNVVMLQQGVTGSLLFMPAAEAQGFHPRYALTTNDAPASLRGYGIPASQLRGAVGVGFVPTKDVNAADDPGTPGAAECDRVMQSHGVALNNRSVTSQAYLRCDHVWALVAALERASGDLSADGIVAGFEAIGSDALFSASFASTYRPTSRDGGGAVRSIAFVSECDCFRYTSDLIWVD